MNQTGPLSGTQNHFHPLKLLSLAMGVICRHSVQAKK